MGFIRRLFKQTEPELVLEHPVFGHLRFSKRGGWQNPAFTLWGFEGVDLTIDAGREGPSSQQIDEFVTFRDSEQSLWPRCLAAVDLVRADLGVPPGRFRIAGLSIPSLGPGTAGTLWSLWIDLEGDDHFQYGVQTQDRWNTLAGFADD